MHQGLRSSLFDDQPSHRRSRRRQVALSCETLDARTLLSTMAANVLAIKPVRLPAAEVSASNASEAQFPMSVGATIRSGQPVAEQVTTTYFDGSIQTESLLKVPNASNNSVTTYKTINLRHDGGTETVVSTETFSGGTTPFTGTDNTYTITTTLPDGAVETETDTDVIDGHKTYITATIQEAGGGVETSTSEQIQRGRTTTTNKTITEADGVIEHQKSVTTGVGDLDSTSSSRTTLPGEIQVSASATNVIREQPPSTLP